MSNTVVATIATMGVDIGKNPFHVAALTLIGMEASVGLITERKLGSRAADANGICARASAHRRIGAMPRAACRPRR
jgi:hypothetical protein